MKIKEINQKLKMRRAPSGFVVRKGLVGWLCSGSGDSSLLFPSGLREDIDHHGDYDNHYADLVLARKNQDQSADRKEQASDRKEQAIVSVSVHFYLQRAVFYATLLSQRLLASYDSNSAITLT